MSNENSEEKSYLINKVSSVHLQNFIYNKIIDGYMKFGPAVAIMMSLASFILILLIAILPGENNELNIIALVTSAAGIVFGSFQSSVVLRKSQNNTRIYEHEFHILLIGLKSGYYTNEEGFEKYKEICKLMQDTESKE